MQSITWKTISTFHSPQNMDEITIPVVHNASKNTLVIHSLTQRTLIFFHTNVNDFSPRDKHLSNFLLNAGTEAIFVFKYH